MKMNKKALLAVSFGTSYEETRKNTIEAIEEDLKAAYPDRTFYRAWTSAFIRKKIRERDGYIVPSVSEALDGILCDGSDDLLIQPILMLAGGEFRKIMKEVSVYTDRFRKIRIGRPIIGYKEDIPEMVSLLSGLFKETAEKQMMAFMGHGSGDAGFSVYEMMNAGFEEAGLSNFCVGTVEYEPGITPVLDKTDELRPEVVYLTPFLIVCGDHANNDMAGDQEDSWKTLIAEKGPAVKCIMKGLGEYEEVRALFVKRSKEAADL